MGQTWSGWQAQFLKQAGVIVTPPNNDFMAAWASHAPGSCHFNPNDLSQAVGGSTRCGSTVGPFGRSQNYATHAEAAHAFAIQMGASWVQPLKAALNTGNPFQIGDRSKVVAVLRRWGSTTFADWYANATTDGTGGGGGGGGTKAPHTHSGYHDLQRSVEKRMPAASRHSQRMMAMALRALGHGRKVRH